MDWLVDPFLRFDHSRPSLSPEFLNDHPQQGAFPVSTRSRLRQSTLRPPPQVLQRIAGLDVYGLFRRSFGVLLGTPEVSLDFFRTEQGVRPQLFQEALALGQQHLLCLQALYGKDEYFQAIQVLAPRFRFFGIFFLETKTREDRLSSFTGTFHLKRLL